ncbi:MAG: hypothetical protein F6K24_17490 [Okeania sp. SIO2D1]|nr:hypothetical protein [Okeania sp. SIO2D1]
MKEIADLFQILRMRSPELKDDNFQVDAELIQQWLEDCISAWYQYVPKYEFSLDVPLKEDEKERETWAEHIADYQYAWDGDASQVNCYHASQANYYQAMGCDIQKSLAEFCQTLNTKEYRLVLLIFSFDWGDVGRNLAPLLNNDQSTINRRYRKVKENWLKSFAEELGVDEKDYSLSKDRALSSTTLEDIWQIYVKPNYRSIIYQELQKIWSKLEPSLQQMLSNNYLKWEPTTADTAKGIIESELLKWFEAELEMSLVFYEPFTKKISNLVGEFFTPIYQEKINHLNTQINSYRERLERLLDANWVEPEKILVSSGRKRRVNVNQLSKEEQSSTPFIQLKRGKKIELDNQKFVLMIKMIQEKENEEMKLSFELLPSGETTTSLPSGLELALLKPSGKVMISTSRSKIGDNQLVLALKISKATMWLEKIESNRKTGKVFQVQITVNGNSKTEPFPSI